MVALNVWPTDAADGSVANEARWRKMGRVWASSGVVNTGGKLAPSLAGTALTVADGAAWVDGHYAELLGSQVLTVTANGIAVVRFDPAANTAELVYRDGVSTPAQSPTGVYELLIAQITGSALVDKRVVLGAGGAPALAMRWKNFDGVVTDGNGLYTVTAAMMGLADLAGLVWDVYTPQYNPTGQATQFVAGSPFRANATTFICPLHAFDHPNGTMRRVTSVSISAYVVAWGTLGPGATALPAPDIELPDDGEPEAKPKRKRKS